MKIGALTLLLPLALVGSSVVSPIRLALADTSGSYNFISKVAIVEGHNLRIDVAGEFPADRAGNRDCNKSYAVSQHDLTNDLTRAQLQVALASFLSQRKVFIVTIGCQQGGNDDGYLLLDTIQLEQP
jgi:hypothetical protein